MRCQECGSENLRCMDSRDSITYPGKRRRRHKCQSCGQTFATIEIPLEEYQELVETAASAASRTDAKEFRRRVLSLLLAIKNDSKGAVRYTVENLLQQIMRMEG